MAEDKKGFLDKAKDKANDVKENTSKEDVSKGWDSTKEKGDKYAGDNEKWNSAKEKGDSVADRVGGDDGKTDVEQGKEKNKKQ